MYTDIKCQFCNGASKRATNNKQEKHRQAAGGRQRQLNILFLSSERDDHGIEQTSRWTRLAGVVRFPLTARPAPKDLSGGSAPYFGCDGALHAVVHSGRSSSATSSRYTFGERRTPTSLFRGVISTSPFFAAHSSSAQRVVQAKD